MNTSHEPYRETFKGEDDSFDVHTIVDRITAIHRNIFSGRTGKTLNNIIQVTGVPSEEYISRKNPVKVHNALLPARFLLLIDGCLHNTSPPLVRFIS